MSIHEDQIKDRAYQLWDEAGQPEGREQEFWYQAERELAERELSGDDEADTSAEPSILNVPPLVPGRII